MKSISQLKLLKVMDALKFLGFFREHLFQGYFVSFNSEIFRDYFLHLDEYAFECTCADFVWLSRIEIVRDHLHTLRLGFQPIS